MDAAKDIVEEAKETIDRPVSVLVENFVLKAKTSKKLYPRGDCDNYAKGALDLMTWKNYWADDDLVTDLLVKKRFAEEGQEPHTLISVYEDIEDEK